MQLDVGTPPPETLNGALWGDGSLNGTSQNPSCREILCSTCNRRLIETILPEHSVTVCRLGLQLSLLRMIQAFWQDELLGRDGSVTQTACTEA